MKKNNKLNNINKPNKIDKIAMTIAYSIDIIGIAWLIYVIIDFYSWRV